MTDSLSPAPPESTVRLDLPPTSVSIAVGRSVIRRIVTFRSSDAESSFLVAFTEILANSIDEHQRLGNDDPVVVEVTRGEHESVRVVDSGDGLTAADPAEDGSLTTEGTVSERGRGLALARAFVADLVLESTDRGTTATLPLDGFGIVR